MAATRTQVYFTTAQRERIDRAARARRVTMAEVIRQAVDQYLGDDADASAVLSTTFGADPTAAVPSRDERARG